MNRRIYQIILSLFLTFVITNQVWGELVQDNPIVAEVETESDHESEREFRLDEFSDSEKDFFGFDSFLKSGTIISLQLFAGFVKEGNSFSLLGKQKTPKLFLLNCQFKLDC